MPIVPIIITPSSTKETFLTSMAGMELSAWCLSRGIINFPMPNEMSVQPVLLPVLQTCRALGTPMLVYYGHGQSDALEGDRKISAIAPKQMWLVSKGWNDQWLKDTITITVACDSMSELGPSAINKGCLAFIGSKQPMYVDIADINTNMINDFVEVFNVVPKTILGNQSKLGPNNGGLGSLISEGLSSFRNTIDKFIALYEKNNMDRQLVYMMQRNKDNYDALIR